MQNANEAPVLLIVFNRPDTTQIVFDAIRRAKPKKLYVSADAPRIGNENDRENCRKTREIVKNVDWDCEVYYQFHEENLGCGLGPVSAISWVFQKEDRAIILEDDCVPALSFFPYCNELLERYKDDNRIWVISGNNYNEERKVGDSSYFISRYGHSWGWATWRRAWNHFDHKMTLFEKFIEQNQIYNAFSDKKQAKFFLKKYTRLYSNPSVLSHIWDFQFGFAVISNGGLSIVPAKNLVSNIGYIGTHSVAKTPFHGRPVDENYKIAKHPDFILPCSFFDEYHFRKHWMKMGKMSIFRRIVRKIVKVINKK